MALSQQVSALEVRLEEVLVSSITIKLNQVWHEHRKDKKKRLEFASRFGLKHIQWIFSLDNGSFSELILKLFCKNHLESVFENCTRFLCFIAYRVNFREE